MPDPAPGAVLPAAPAPAAAPAAPKPAAMPAPAPAAQPTPAAAPKPGAPAAAPAAQPAPAAPAPSQVPLAVLMEERDKRQQLQAELDSLKQIQQRQQVAPGFQQPQQQPQADLRAQLDQLWQTDPRKAVQTEIALAAQWQDNVNAQVDTEAETLSAKYKDFNDYRNTAMRYVRALPLDQRARPGIVEMAFLVTRGQSVDQIIEAQRQAMATQFQQNPAMFQMPAGASAGSQAPATGPQATEAQIRAAGAMKVPIDQYMKWVK